MSHGKSHDGRRGVVFRFRILCVGWTGSASPTNRIISPAYPLYIGAGASGVHHTGYVPGTGFSFEIYVPGAKAYLGYVFNEWVGVEAAYHYLGEAGFPEGMPRLSRERSHSASATALLYLPTAEIILPSRMFLRGGVAYKDIAHAAVAGNFHEGVIAWVVGIGIEIQFTQRIFGRVEYEFISRGLSGTDRVVNVMHTPLSASLGVRF